VLKTTWARVAAWRLARQHLDRRAPKGSLLAVASRLCGLHAQLMSSAELAAWARVADLRRGDVARALWDERTLVKTWAMRGTLHLLPAAELPLWIAALRQSPRYLRESAWKNYFGLTLEELDRITQAIAAALHDRVLTRDELSAEIARTTRSATASRALALSSWGVVLKPAAFTGGLCFGPSVGSRVRFTHPDTWLPSRGAPIEADESGPTIARRFLAAYGPATFQDFARWWTGGGIATARRWIGALGDQVSPIDIEGTSAFVLASDVRAFRAAPPRLTSVRLLPAFDPSIVAASWHAHHLLPPNRRADVYRPQGWISPVLLVNGQMRGVWRHDVKSELIEVRVKPFTPQPAWVRRAAADEAERLAAFFDRRLRFVWGRQENGPATRGTRVAGCD